MSESSQIELNLSPTQAAIDTLEAGLFGMHGRIAAEAPLTHRFAPGVYAREIFMPAGTFVIGHRHKTEHFNIILTGRAKVMMDDGGVYIVQAPCVLKSEAGIRKVLLIEEDMRWMTIHPTHETDLEKLEEELILKSQVYLENEHKKLWEKLQTQAPEKESLCHS